jgi:hypothetical protein
MDMELILSLHDRLLLDKKAETELQIARLEKEFRQDEANLMKVRRNVLEVFRTLLRISRKEGGASVTAYRALINKVTHEWQEARELAASHQDVQRLAVEDVKWAAFQEVLKNLNALEEGRA